MLEAHEPSNELEKRYAGVRALWAKVIIRAMYDFVMYKDSDKLPLRRTADNASRWLFSKNESLNSLESVCGMLGISPNSVREKAINMPKSEVSKIEHIDRSFDYFGGSSSPDVVLLLQSCRSSSVDLLDVEDEFIMELEG